MTGSFERRLEHHAFIIVIAFFLAKPTRGLHAENWIASRRSARLLQGALDYTAATAADGAMPFKSW